MKFLSVVIVAVVIAVIGVIGFAYSGVYNVSANSSHNGGVQWLLATTSNASIKRHARSIEVPDLEDQALIFSGINDFDAMCVGCHGGPGKDPDAMGQGLNPPAPDLSEVVAESTSAELFWVTKNGIKMTGMPSWGATHGDNVIWPVIAFLKKLPDLDALGYQTMLVAAQGHGHHAQHLASDDGSNGDSEASSNNSTDVQSENQGGELKESPQQKPAEEHDHAAHDH